MKEVLKTNALCLTKDVIKTIGYNIKYLREQKKATQSEVAYLIETDKCIISNIERGTSNNITLLTLVKLSILFEIEVIELLK